MQTASKYVWNGWPYLQRDIESRTLLFLVRSPYMRPSPAFRNEIAGLVWPHMEVCYRLQGVVGKSGGWSGPRREGGGGFERYWFREGNERVSLEKGVRRQRRHFFLILCVYTQNSQKFRENSCLC